MAKSALATPRRSAQGVDPGRLAMLLAVLERRVTVSTAGLDVYALARRYNERAGREIIPTSVITKPPSAELRPDQRDDQSLPPYDELDPLLQEYIEGDHTMAELIEKGFDEATVRRITRLVDIAEFKRRQTPLGPRVTRKGFGRDRRLPITNGYR